MSIVVAVHDYVSSFLTRLPGMKTLLLDSETVGIVSMVLTQSQILEQEVFLVEVIDKDSPSDPAGPASSMKHLKAVAFLRPTAANFIALAKELKNPRFAEYHLFFTNVVPHSRLEQLAACDEAEMVHQVQESFADFYPINSDLFSLNIPSTVLLTAQISLWTSYEESIVNRIVDGVFASALALRMHPHIRYARSSPLCFKIAQLVQARIDEEHLLFDQLNPSTSSSSVILISDRRLDPVTPLLNQWTYQAMCHELIGLEKNRMDLRKPTSLPGAPRKELEEIVMSSAQDKFYQENLVSNFGDLATNIEHYLSKYQEHTKNNSKLESLADMQKFIDQFPEFRKLSGNVSKHVTVVHELSRLVNQGNLINVSALEQEIACEDSRMEQFRKIQAALSDPTNPQLEKLRLVLLYAVKYSLADPVGVNQFKTTLSSLGVGEEQVGLVELLVEYSSGMFKQEDLVKKNVLSMIRNATGIGGVENIYTQHKSILNGTLDHLLKGKLKEAMFPFADSKRRPTPPLASAKPAEVLAFIVGGATYEEARDVSNLNQGVISGGQRIVLGSTSMLNSKTFLADIAQLRRRAVTVVSGTGRD